MNKRQRERLNSLANFIEKNPEKYNQEGTATCIVGIGNRLSRGKLVSDYFSTEDEVDTFAEKFGVSYETSYNIWMGRWSLVNRKTKNARRKLIWGGTVVANVPARRAVAFLRQVAKNHP